jgi:hypothetical protein
MPTVVVSGSMRKHYDGMVRAIQEFEKRGITVLSPRVSSVINPGHSFVLLGSDKTTNRATLEQSHLDAISRADALYVHDPKVLQLRLRLWPLLRRQSYIGESTGYEIAWARRESKPVFLSEELPPDSIYKFHAMARVASIETIAAFLRGEAKV